MNCEFTDFVYQKIDNVEKPFKERQTILIGGKTDFSSFGRAFDCSGVKKRNLCYQRVAGSIPASRNLYPPPSINGVVVTHNPREG